MMRILNSSKKAFTLAEVLITLVIIGVVAAMTVPALMNNTHGTEFRAALKKAISATNQALALHNALEGMTAQDYETHSDLVDAIFKQRLSLIDGPSAFTIPTACSGTTFTTQDGIMYCVGTNYISDNSDLETSKCNMYNTTPCSSDGEANFWIDVNGVKKPNTATSSAMRPKDIYQAMIYAQRIVPHGAPTQEILFEAGIYGDEINRSTT